MKDLWFQIYKRLKKHSDAGPWPEVQAFWRFMAIYGIFGIFAKKSDRKSDPIFPILSVFFRFLDFSRLLDFQIPQL